MKEKRKGNIKTSNEITFHLTERGMFLCWKGLLGVQYKDYKKTQRPLQYWKDDPKKLLEKNLYKRSGIRISLDLSIPTVEARR